MVHVKQPGKIKHRAQFLGLLPRPGVSYGQPDSSSDNRTKPNSVHSNDAACANGQGGFDVIKEQAVHLPFLPAVQKLAHISIQQLLLTAVGRLRF